MRVDQDRIDIVVVGAGPAGSTAAEAAAKKGFDVVLIDRKREIGSPVQCGGFLPEVGELRDLLPGAKIPDALAEIPERQILHRTSIRGSTPPRERRRSFLFEEG